MNPNNEQHRKLWAAMIFAIIFCTIGSGFYRNLSAGDNETYKGLQIFSEVIDLIENNYVDPVDSKELIQKAIHGMVNSLDPHSQLLPPEAFKELQIDTEGEFGGIGIVITMQKGVLTVISPIEGTPAHKAGIKAGDIIIKVNDEPTKDMMLWEAVNKMRGPKGESVKITIVRKGAAKPIVFNITRDIIPIESVKYITLKSGFGYIRVTNFQKSTTDDLKSAMDALESEMEMEGLILDLRDNPGGLLTQAIQMSDVFLSDGAIVSIRGRHEEHTRSYNAHDDTQTRLYPLVVLINGGSASASEIVAGALQDHKRALILGTTSFGKGSVQTVESLRDGYGLKYTIARYYTPNGKSIQAQGIEPDITIKHEFINLEEKEGEGEGGLLKEKDLKNHLEAEPDLIIQEIEEETEEGAEEPEKSEDLENTQKRDYRYGPLEIDALMTDNQVVRALEILEGFNILKN